MRNAEYGIVVTKHVSQYIKTVKGTVLFTDFKDPSTALGVTRKTLGVTDFVISTEAERSFLKRKEKRGIGGAGSLREQF